MSRRKAAADPGLSTPRPTRRELDILQILWRRGPSTVREVHSDFGGRGGYTTILKLMQIMTEKRLVEREDQQRTHIYRAAQPESSTQSRLVADLMQRAFDGSARKLIQAALSSSRATPEELEEIRQMLERVQRDQGDSP